MTYERFKEIWNQLMPNRTLTGEPSDLSLNISPRLEAALIAEANGDSSAFDAIQPLMRPLPTAAQLAAEQPKISAACAATQEVRARMNALTPAQREEYYQRGMQMIYARWWPIASAPKDGAYILLAGPSGYIDTPLRAEICHYDAEYRPLQPWVNHAGDSFEDGGPPATLWMPLPAAP